MNNMFSPTIDCAGKFLHQLMLAVALLLVSASATIARQPPASIVIDANSGRTLHAHAADQHRYPASLTKMMTVYLMFNGLSKGQLRLSDRITFSANAAGQVPSKLGLQPGQTITIQQAIRALIAKSANDVATAVAEHIDGSEAAFARRMTRTARTLGMTKTVFRNASGLPDPEQVTTARDMAILGMALQDDFPRRYRYFATRHFRFGKRRYTNFNRLLGRVAGVDGIKTGYTRASGFNIATSLRKDGRHLVAVVIGQRSGRGRNAVMRRLLAQYLPKASLEMTRRQKLLVKRRVPTRRHTAPKRDDFLALREPKPHPPKLLRLPQLVNRSAILTPNRHDRAVSGSNYQVQVGAFNTDNDARQALAAIKAKAGPLLDGYRPVSVKAQANRKTVYRARFAGFDQPRAQATCAKLKTVRVDCFVTRIN